MHEAMLLWIRTEFLQLVVLRFIDLHRARIVRVLVIFRVVVGDFSRSTVVTMMQGTEAIAILRGAIVDHVVDMSRSRRTA
jgi:hypothetical protein